MGDILRRLRPDPYFLAGGLAVALAAGIYVARGAAGTAGSRTWVFVQDSVVQRLLLGGAAHSIGASTAPVTVVEFVDYQCPACALAPLETWPRLRDLAQRGKVRFVVADLPVGHYINAVPAAVLAHCVALVDEPRFWMLRDTLLRDQQEWGHLYPPQDGLVRLAAAVGADSSRVTRCIQREGGAYAEALLTDGASLQHQGVRYAPFWLLNGHEVRWRSLADSLGRLGLR